MLVEAVRQHVASFPAGAWEYRPLVEILDQLRAAAAMTAIDAGRVAAKLVAGQVPTDKLKKAKDKLAACPEGNVGKQIWILRHGL
jgi:hypothetical protein